MATDTLSETGFFGKHREKIDFHGAGGCWLWTAGKFRSGYGAVGSGGKVRRAHREAYEAENGAGSADGLVIRHKCDTPACVNPDHLEGGTVADNNRDRDKRGRQARGSTHGQATLTEAEVAKIRADCVPGSRTHGTRALGRQYGVSGSQISLIVRRATWAHI